MNLKGKIVVVTGSSKGIGQETVKAFAAEKANVVITYNSDRKGGIEAEKECISLGASGTLLLHLNVTDDRNIKSAVKEIVKKFGKIDILINNSGVISWDDFKSQSFKTIESQVRTNLEGLIKMTSACIPYVKESIINVSSRAGKTPYSDLTVYCAAKYGARGFTQSLALAYPNLRIVSLNPHMTATQMTGFKGVSPSKVAGVILKFSKGEIKPDKLNDIDVWKFI